MRLLDLGKQVKKLESRKDCCYIYVFPRILVPDFYVLLNLNHRDIT